MVFDHFLSYIVILAKNNRETLWKRSSSVLKTKWLTLIKKSGRPRQIWKRIIYQGSANSCLRAKSSHTHSFTLLSKAFFKIETIWPQKPKTFTIWSFTEKVCWHLILVHQFAVWSVDPGEPCRGSVRSKPFSQWYSHHWPFSLCWHLQWKDKSRDGCSCLCLSTKQHSGP